ncbi:Mur ligase family protein [bacterium]|nr:Mur ligase family protein [bacterium]
MGIDQKFGIFEAGISTPDEMELLGQIVKADLMIVTNVFQSHMEFFQSHQDLVEEKLKLSLSMKSGATLILPKYLSDKYFNLLRSDLKLISFEELVADPDQVDKIGYGPALSFELAKIALKSMNIEVDLDQKLAVTPLRMEKRIKENQAFLLDCYNASPESMRSLFQSIPTISETIFVLGDMLELGQNSKTLHYETLHQLLLLKPKKVLLFGEIFSKAWEEMENTSIVVQRCEEIKDAVSYLRSQKCDCIAIKASRYFALERIYHQY